VSVVFASTHVGNAVVLANCALGATECRTQARCLTHAESAVETASAAGDVMGYPGLFSLLDETIVVTVLGKYGGRADATMPQLTTLQHVHLDVMECQTHA